MFMFSFRVSFDANVGMISSTTGRKRGSSDSKGFNFFHCVQVINYGAFQFEFPDKIVHQGYFKEGKVICSVIKLRSRLKFESSSFRPSSSGSQISRCGCPATKVTHGLNSNSMVLLVFWLSITTNTPPTGHTLSPTQRNFITLPTREEPGMLPKRPPLRTHSELWFFISTPIQIC